MQKDKNPSDEFIIEKPELLEDNVLESLGFIKQINTMAIIGKVEEAERKKSLWLQDILYALLGSFIIVLQFIMVYKLGITTALLIDFLISLPTPVLVLISTNKKYKGGLIQ